MNQSYIEEQGKKIENFLRHSFDNISVTHVEPSEVESRATVGFDAQDNKDEYQVYYRIQVPPETKQDILETRGDVYEYLERQLIDMETLSSAPDTMILFSDNPPLHIKKPLIFYVLSTL